MKKIFTLALLMAAATGIASAQVWVGGSINISDSEAESNDNKNISKQISFQPTVGYDLNEKLSVGVSLSYSHNSMSTNHNNITLNHNINNFSIRPFVRYHYMEWGKLRAFVDGGVGYSLSNVCNDDNDYQSLSVFIQPGFSYDLNDRFSIETSFGNLSYTHTWYDSYVFDSANSLNLSLTNSIAIGFIVKL